MLCLPAAECSPCEPGPSRRASYFGVELRRDYTPGKGGEAADSDDDEAEPGSSSKAAGKGKKRALSAASKEAKEREAFPVKERPLDGPSPKPFPLFPARNLQLDPYGAMDVGKIDAARALVEGGMPALQAWPYEFLPSCLDPEHWGVTYGHLAERTARNEETAGLFVAMLCVAQAPCNDAGCKTFAPLEAMLPGCVVLELGKNVRGLDT